MVGLYQVVNVQEVHLAVWTTRREQIHTSLDHVLHTVDRWEEGVILVTFRALSVQHIELNNKEHTDVLH